MSKKLTDKEIYDFFRASYYCGCIEQDDGYNQISEEYENWQDGDIEEKIKEDVENYKSLRDRENAQSERKIIL